MLVSVRPSLPCIDIGVRLELTHIDCIYVSNARIELLNNQYLSGE